MSFVFLSTTFLLFFLYNNLTAQKPDSDVKEEKPYKLSLVRDAPVYPGCEHLDNEFYIRKFLSESISDHFRSNFNSSMLKTTDSETGAKFLAVFFNINEDGQISVIYVRAPDNKLEAEVLRVVDRLPKMMPGKIKDNPVKVKFNVIISMENEELVVKAGSSAY
jgi:protein TonB